MNISGIRPSIGFYDYNSIKIRPEAINTSIEETDETLDKASGISNFSVKISDDEIAAAREKQTYTSFDYAEQFKPNETYELKGADSDIKSLDVEKAVNDMQKDSVIHSYQFFVKDRAITAAGETSIRGAEDFAL